MRYRGELTDQEWKRLEPLLPAEKPDTGRPNADHRRIINGIVWRERTGAPWRDLPERYGPWSTVYSRFWRWHEAGIWGPDLRGHPTARGPSWGGGLERPVRGRDGDSGAPARRWCK